MGDRCDPSHCSSGDTLNGTVRSPDGSVDPTHAYFLRGELMSLTRPSPALGFQSERLPGEEEEGDISWTAGLPGLY